MLFVELLLLYLLLFEFILGWIVSSVFNFGYHVKSNVLTISCSVVHIVVIVLKIIRFIFHKNVLLLHHFVLLSNKWSPSISTSLTHCKKCTNFAFHLRNFEFIKLNFVLRKVLICDLAFLLILVVIKASLVTLVIGIIPSSLWAIDKSLDTNHWLFFIRG